MPVTVSIPGWPLMVVDTPEEQVERNKKRKKFRLSQPIVYETNYNGRPARIRATMHTDGEFYAHACEYFYHGVWHEIVNEEIKRSLVNEFRAGANSIEKCNQCRHSATQYDGWICAWRAVCASLGTAIVISEYTEDEETAPEWDVDLGRGSDYCEGSKII